MAEFFRFGGSSKSVKPTPGSTFAGIELPDFAVGSRFHEWDTGIAYGWTGDEWLPVVEINRRRGAREITPVQAFQKRLTRLNRTIGRLAIDGPTIHPLDN